MKNNKGFTVVELLIVIVVIAILAAITVVAYRGIQSRARDAKRLSSGQNIVKAINTYRAMNGAFPPATINGTAMSGWETSFGETEGMFLHYLKNGNGFSGEVPIDPKNNNTSYYGYYRYAAGTNGCDATRGDYFVFGIKKMESSSRPHEDSPGWSCSSRDWVNDFAWVTGGYTY